MQKPSSHWGKPSGVVAGAEREALSLIHFLRDQGQPQSEWLAALSADQTLSEPVRQRALAFVPGEKASDRPTCPFAVRLIS